MIDRNSRGAPPLRKRGRREGLTGGAGGVGLDGLALLDEFVLLGRGGVKSSLDGGTEDGGAQLGGEPRGVAEDLALSEHFVFVFVFFRVGLFSCRSCRRRVRCYGVESVRALGERSMMMELEISGMDESSRMRSILVL